MIVGYARTSTVRQVAGLENQCFELERAGSQKIFHEQTSSKRERPQLDLALEFVREGDVLVITKIDRLARSMRDLMNIIDELNRKGVAFRVLSLNLDTSTATGKLMVTVLGGVAEWEWDIMQERVAIGIAKAKADGKYKGREPTVRRKQTQILADFLETKSASVTARKFNVARSSVYRMVEEARADGLIVEVDVDGATELRLVADAAAA